MLVQHGEKDQSVPLLQAQVFVEKLKQSGNAATLLLYPNYDHALLKLEEGRETQSEVHQAALAFFKKHLKQ